MASKRQELANMRAEMYQKLESVKQNYENYTPLEKAYFVQKAFYDVNSYCCKMWNMNENNTAFGFMIGQPGFRAVAGNPREAGPFVAFNIGAAVSINNPYEIYKTLLHEMKHIHQSVAFTPGRVLYDKLYPANFQRQQTHARWLSSPKETESDDFAFKHLAKITKTGILKSETRVEACKQTQFYKGARVQSFVNHIKGVGMAAIESFKGLFGSKFKPTEEQFVNRETNGGARFLNFGTIAQVLKGLPYQVNHHTDLKSPVFREYVNSKGDVPFIDRNYFGVSREFNKEATKIAVENYEKGDVLKITQFQQERLSAARREDIEKDMFLRHQYELKHGPIKEVAAQRDNSEKIAIDKDLAKEIAANMQQALQNVAKNENIQNLNNAINNLNQQNSGVQTEGLSSNSTQDENIVQENEQVSVAQQNESKESEDQVVGSPSLKDEILQHIAAQREENTSQDTVVPAQTVEISPEAPSVEVAAAAPEQ